MRVDLFIFHGFATERRRRSILSFHLFLSFIRRHPLGVLITFMANKPGRRRRPDTHTRRPGFNFLSQGCVLCGNAYTPHTFTCWLWRKRGTSSSDSDKEGRGKGTIIIPVPVPSIPQFLYHKRCDRYGDGRTSATANRLSPARMKILTSGREAKACDDEEHLHCANGIAPGAGSISISINWELIPF